MGMKNPIYLTLTRSTPDGEVVTVAHPNEIDAIGTDKWLGKKGLRVIVRHRGHVWRVTRSCNTQFTRAYDKAKIDANIPYDHPEGERWLDDGARVIIWRAMWR